MNRVISANTTHICLCFDGNVNRQVLLTASSAAGAAAGAVGAHFVCVESAAEGFARELEAMGEGRKFEALTHVVPDEMLDKLPDTKWLPRASCLRLFISSVLPAELERVVYLDCDILVTADLAELYGTDMGGRPVAAVRDRGMRPLYCAPLGLDARNYFNAGMLLVDLKKWGGPAQKALDLIASGGTIYPCLDQDVLNIVFKGNWLELEQRWNILGAQQPFASRWFGMFATERMKRAELPPAVYHFTPVKPWDVSCVSRARFAYRRMARALFGAGGIPFVNRASRMFKVFAWLPSPLYRLANAVWESSIWIRHRMRKPRK